MPDFSPSLVIDDHCTASEILADLRPGLIDGADKNLLRILPKKRTPSEVMFPPGIACALIRVNCYQKKITRHSIPDIMLDR